MSQQASQTEFVSQTTHFYFGAFTFTLAGAFSLVCGLLVLICGWKNRDGTSATMPGIMMTAIGLFTLPLGVHSVFHILARRRPIMRLYREGIEVNKIGASFLEKENEGERVVPKVAQVLRVAWPVFSGQGFKREVLRAPWEHFRYAQAMGLPKIDKMAIGAMFFRRGRESPDAAGAIMDRITFKPVDLVVPLDEVAAAIEKHFRNTTLREALPSWNE